MKIEVRAKSPAEAIKFVIEHGYSPKSCIKISDEVFEVGIV